MQKVLVFDIGSSFGYFRKAFTTTNSLTHALIPRSAVEGLVAAIIGLPRTDYPKILQAGKIAIQILAPVRKMNMSYMHINPDWGNEISLYLFRKPRTNVKPAQFAVPTSVEFLVNPRYRIYIDNPLTHKQLMSNLEKKQTFFTPYLGTSSMISFVKYVGEYDYSETSSEEDISVSSIIPFTNKIPTIKLEKGIQFAIEENLPLHLDDKRIPFGVYKVLYNPEMRPITLIDEDRSDIKKIDGKTYVKFLPTQVPS
jgi:CRISPR-associated protein Cas5h